MSIIFHLNETAVLTRMYSSRMCTAREGFASLHPWIHPLLVWAWSRPPPPVISAWRHRPKIVCVETHQLYSWRPPAIPFNLSIWVWAMFKTTISSDLSSSPPRYWPVKFCTNFFCMLCRHCSLVKFPNAR